MALAYLFQLIFSNKSKYQIHKHNVAIPKITQIGRKSLLYVICFYEVDFLNYCPKASLIAMSHCKIFLNKNLYLINFE